MRCKATKNIAKKDCELLCRLLRANHGARGEEHPTSQPSWAANCLTVERVLVGGLLWLGGNSW